MPDFTIKGNPGEIRSRGQTCADKGRFFDQTGDALTKIDTQGWIGRAADNFRDAHDREPNRWYEAGTGFRAAGNALIDYASALETAQQNAATAKSEYERGEGVTAQAKADYADYSARFDQARSDALAGGYTYPYTKESFSDPGEEIRRAALELLAQAKSDLKAAAGRCAREVRVGCKDAPDKRNWFESGLAFVGGIFEGAGEAVWDIAKMGYNMGPLHDIIEFATGDLTAEELAAQKAMRLEDAEALWQALKSDPLEFGKQLGKGLLDWDTWADDPARAIGHLVPDAVAAVFSGGTATVATRGIKGGADALDALGDMNKGLRGLDNLDGLGDVGKVDNGLDNLDDLGDLGKLDDAKTPDTDTDTPPDRDADSPSDPNHEASPDSDRPDDYGVDENGNPLPYSDPANRPSYAPGQVDEVWENAKNADGEVWVLDKDGNRYEIEWEPGQSRQGIWDMGHVPGQEYRRLHDDYLNHRITKEEFLEEYRDPDNYRVEDPGRNRSHTDEQKD